jgi:carbon monoxide dehydrogenase subunit G
MACIRKEVTIAASPDAVWDAVRDFGAVHKRLVPGLVADSRLEDGARIVTFANGMVVRELIVDIDDQARRLAYAAVGGRAAHHNASMQVFPEGETHSRLVWITDVLPDELTGPIRANVEHGSEIMKRTLELPCLDDK